MKDDIESYVKTFLVSQQEKIEQKISGGLLEPLPIPERPWESVFIDFISTLPKFEEYRKIITVVDEFSKYIIFIFALIDCTVEEAACLFSKHIVKYWGILSSIMSN